MNEPKKLYRTEGKDAKVFGVCGGIAEYFSVDPTLIRLAWVLFSALGGSGVLAYIICALVFPQKPVDD